MNITIDRDLLLEFFLTFAAFEFALKNSGLRRKGRQIVQGVTNIAEPDWVGFALQLHDTFILRLIPDFAKPAIIFSTTRHIVRSFQETDYFGTW